MTTAPREANAGNFRSFSRVSFGYLSINSPNTASQVKLPPPEAVALLCSHLEGAFEVRVVSVV